MNRSGLLPLWLIILIIIIILIVVSEITLRKMTSSSGFLLLGDIALLIWGILMFAGGIFSLLSYFFESRWKGFQGLIWVYRTIIPVGGKVNAIIFGLIGIVVGAVAILYAYFFFLSSISFDSLSISSGLVL